MSIIPKEIGKAFIEAWRKAEKLLEETRAVELPMTDTVKGLQSLLPVFSSCLNDNTPKSTSGLIEQQRIFSRARPK